MASFTANYNLDLYEAGDIPNLLDQYNGAMGKVDTALASVNTVATAAGTTASGAQTAAAAAQTAADTAQAKADGAMLLAQTNESDIASLETTVQQHTTAISTINGDIAELGQQVNQNAADITEVENSIQTIGTAHRSSGKITVPGTLAGTTIETSSNDCYKDSALHLASFALNIKINGLSSQTSIPAGTAIGTLPDNFKPSTQRTLQCSMQQYTFDSNGDITNSFSKYVQIGTDGTLKAVSVSGDPTTITIPANGYVRLIMAQPCLFTHDWGANY